MTASHRTDWMSPRNPTRTAGAGRRVGRLTTRMPSNRLPGVAPNSRVVSGSKPATRSTRVTETNVSPSGGAARPVRSRTAVTASFSVASAASRRHASIARAPTRRGIEAREPIPRAGRPMSRPGRRAATPGWESEQVGETAQVAETAQVPETAQASAAAAFGSGGPANAETVPAGLSPEPARRRMTRAYRPCSARRNGLVLRPPPVGKYLFSAQEVGQSPDIGPGLVKRPFRHASQRRRLTHRDTSEGGRASQRPSISQRSRSRPGSETSMRTASDSLARRSTTACQAGSATRRNRRVGPVNAELVRTDRGERGLQVRLTLDNQGRAQTHSGGRPVVQRDETEPEAQASARGCGDDLPDLLRRRSGAGRGRRAGGRGQSGGRAGAAAG